MLLQCPRAGAAAAQHRRPPPHAEPDRGQREPQLFRLCYGAACPLGVAAFQGAVDGYRARTCGPNLPGHVRITRRGIKHPPCLAKISLSPRSTWTLCHPVLFADLQ